MSTLGFKLTLLAAAMIVLSHLMRNAIVWHNTLQVGIDSAVIVILVYTWIGLIQKVK